MDNRSASPIRLSAKAAARLPRTVLLALLAVYALCRLFSDGIWTMREAVSLGIAESMARGPAAHWFVPTIAGTPLAEYGPVHAWPAAAAMKLLDGLVDPITVATVAGAFWFALGATAVWYAVWHLARRPEAQPVAFAFGGEASPRDFSRTVGDSGALFVASTIGLVMRLHGLTTEIALFAFAASSFCALVWSLEHPKAGSVLTGVFLALAALANQPRPAIAIAASTVLVILWVKEAAGSRAYRLALVASSAAIVLAAFCLLANLVAGEAAAMWIRAWWDTIAASACFFDPETGEWLLHNLGWYLWPMWPAVLLAIWNWRRQLTDTHILVPTVTLACWAAFWATSSSGTVDDLVLAAVPALAALAAFGLLTFRSSLDSMLDWFSVAVFSIAAAGIWIYYCGWVQGSPERLFHTIDRLVSGLPPGASVLAVTTAIAASLVWVCTTAWRLTSRPVAAWRGAWFSALGVTLVCLLACTLFSRVIDENRSYAKVASSIHELSLPYGAAVPIDARDIPVGVKALLIHYEGLNLAGDEASPLLLRRGRVTDPATIPEGYEPLGGALARTHTGEVFNLFVRRR